ncbi:MAG: YggS family pyridoxal phosphate-dependent enzyme [Candidatus Wallbacteria bacterium]|nr:YggS family pyridoxal phosphate-dependent enzyme [Candidatus Wallbacteria bacterium]
MISDSLRALEAEFAARLGADWRERLTLVAVSKTAEPAAIREAFEAGQTDFAENRVQELLRKQDALADLPIRWHLIGHLQTNKVRQVVGRVETIQSVDSVRLAEAIRRECEKRDVTCRILVEVKTSVEPSKTGIDLEDAPEAVRQVLEMDRLILDGLMTMAPLEGGPDSARASFRKLRELHDALRASPGLGYRGTVLSMGMSQDFLVALDEGSTMVRIGTRIFRG